MGATHGLLAAHWLRHEVEKLTPVERLKFSEQVAKASDNRDRAMRMLNLGKREQVDLKTYLVEGDVK